jgi:hypothetical protein
MQREPAVHIERRVEHLELVDDYHYAATVTQQFTIPVLESEQRVDRWPALARTRVGAIVSTATSARPPATASNLIQSRIVPIGWFDKDRLPDIGVTSGAGVALPVLTREDQPREHGRE